MPLHQSLTCVGEAGLMHRQSPGLESERGTFGRSGLLLPGLENVECQYVARSDLMAPLFGAFALSLHPMWTPIEGIGLFQPPLTWASKVSTLESVLRDGSSASATYPVSSGEVVPDFVSRPLSSFLVRDIFTSGLVLFFKFCSGKGSRRFLPWSHLGRAAANRSFLIFFDQDLAACFRDSFVK